MTIYDEFMQDAIDVHCHIDFEFSAKERKREPEFQWLPKAEIMGMRGVVLKSHWWPTVNVVPYILSSVQTKVALWSSVALNRASLSISPPAAQTLASSKPARSWVARWSFFRPGASAKASATGSNRTTKATLN